MCMERENRAIVDHHIKPCFGSYAPDAVVDLNAYMFIKSTFIAVTELFKGGLRACCHLGRCKTDADDACCRGGHGHGTRHKSRRHSRSHKSESASNAGSLPADQWLVGTAAEDSLADAGMLVSN